MYKQKTQGFTIVELLVVIVVIAILAAVSIVAYNGIQNRANDTAVQSDITNLAKQIEVHRALEGELPPGGRTYIAGGHDNGTGQGLTSLINTFPDISFSVARSAYDEPTGSSVNIIYCTGPSTTTGEHVFAIMSRSKSQQAYVYRSASGGLAAVGSRAPSVAFTCQGIGFPRTLTYGYFGSYGGWQSWTE